MPEKKSLNSAGENRFFIVGAMRSGTTYLSTILDEHPEISMAKPLLPEPKFFIKPEEYSRGINYYEKNYFNEKKNVKIYGEKTVHYFEREDALKKIKTHYPGCKIIIILRDPVFRSLSNYYFSVKNDIESRSLWEVFIENLPEPKCKRKMYISPFDYLKRSIYIDYINMFKKYFHISKIKILIMEEFLGNKKQIKNVFKFLGVSSNFIPVSINNKIHENPIITENIDHGIITVLTTYFKKHNKRLEKYLGIKLNKWI